MRIILLFLATFLFADEKFLMAKFKDLKPYYYNNQIVHLNLKVISAKNGYLDLYDDNNKTYMIYKDELDDDYTSHITFKLQNKFPKFRLVLSDTNQTLSEMNVTIDSKIKFLHPPKDFCNVLADNIQVTEKILTNYDNNHNIVYWTISTKNGNLEDFKLHLPDEKLYFLDKNDTFSSYSYSAIVPRDDKTFNLVYFNLLNEKYQKLSFNVKLKNDIVSTQTDIKPMAKSNIYIIDAVIGVLILLWILLYFYKRKIIYIILILMALGSLAFINKPKPEIVLKEGTQIHILPFKNSTIFLVVSIDTKVKVLDSKDGYKKIEFNKYIGWVKDE